MAIAKMKKLRLMVVRSQKDALLDELQRLSCVQVFEPDQEEFSEPSLTASVKKEDADLTQYKTQEASVQRAVGVLKKYAPAKGGLLSPNKIISQDEFFSDDTLEEGIKDAAVINSDEDRIKRIAAEESRQNALIESLTPWKDFDVPIECTGTERTSLLTGILPAKADFAEVAAKVNQITDEAELFKVGEDKIATYVALICMKEYTDQIQELLRGEGFTASSLSDMTGTPSENIKASEKELELLGAEKEKLTQLLAAEGSKRESLQLTQDRLITKINRAESEGRIYGTDSTVFLEGWLIEDKEPEFLAVANKYDCAYELEEPKEEEYPDVPVKLNNNDFSTAGNMITDMYALPQYGSVDPNPRIAPFFILFYGLMLCDMGYGLLMIIAALLVLKKQRPSKERGMYSVSRLMLYAGISTFIMGALTGSFFSDAPYQIVHMLNPNSTWQGLPALFSPLKDSVYILVGAMVLGLIQLNVGMAISFRKKKNRGQILDAILYEGALWVILIGAALVLTKVSITAGKIVLLVGVLMLVYGAVKDAKGLGKITGIFGLAYNELTGWFGDLLSYSRIMALMLAGSVIGQVFNTIGSITNNIFLFIIIFLIGHTLNFGLNLLGCYVHDLRLQCLEYFNKFYEDGGKKFTPLGINTKYYDVIK